VKKLREKHEDHDETSIQIERHWKYYIESILLMIILEIILIK
jgi:uncharacterized membrane protein YiaA